MTNIKLSCHTSNKQLCAVDDQTIFKVGRVQQERATRGTLIVHLSLIITTFVH
jgi:hypothetical protein